MNAFSMRWAGGARALRAHPAAAAGGRGGGAQWHSAHLPQPAEAGSWMEADEGRLIADGGARELFAAAESAAAAASAAAASAAAGAGHRESAKHATSTVSLWSDTLAYTSLQ